MLFYMTNRKRQNIKELYDINTGAVLPQPRGFRARQVEGTLGKVVYVRLGYRAVLCDGEAHTNAHIDHCMRCAPMWGVMAVKVGIAK